ncbi:MAG: NB-ARC domain-containing protein [Cyanobacteriota bacterium]
MPTLKASRQGKAKINQARNEKGWGWNIGNDDTCFIEASKVLEPEKNWFSGGPYANGISEGTWRRFLAGTKPISAVAFKAYCQVLELNWEEIVDRASTATENSRQDWEAEIDTSIFYGRTTELAQLEQCIVTERCRLVALLGMGGIGKTSLGVKLAKQIQPSFEFLSWRSLRSAPPVQETLADWIDFLSEGRETNCPQTVDAQVSRLIEYLRANPCLLVLDDVETVLRSGELAGQYRDGYQDYGKLIRRVGQERHQSCLLLISREKPIEIAAMAGASLPIRDLRIKGLPKEDAKRILEAKGLFRKDGLDWQPINPTDRQTQQNPPLQRGWEELIQIYRGHPAALKIMATTIQEIFDGNIFQFLEESTLVIGDILPNVLSQQFERLSSLEKGIIYWLAIEQQPISIPELRKDGCFFVSSSAQLIAALESLKRRSLLEEEPNPEGRKALFTIQPVLKKYVTNQLIEQVCQDLVAVIDTQCLDHLGLLRSLCLVKESEQEDFKQIQIRLILTRVVERLHMILRVTNSMKERLNEILLMLQGKPPQTIGYAQSNIRNLLQFIENNVSS